MDHENMFKLIIGVTFASVLITVPLAQAAPQKPNHSPPPSRGRTPIAAHTYNNPNVSRAPFRAGTLRNNPLNKNTALNKNAAFNKNTALNRNAALKKNAALNRNTALNKNAAFNKHTALNTHTALNKNTAFNKQAAFNKKTAFNGTQFKIPKKPNPNIPSLHKPGVGNIPGSQNWKGPKYAPFKNYQPVWQSKFWWTHHYNNIVFVSGGWYAWEAGYWIPAWGYDSAAVYYYDGPIYACSCEIPPNPCDVLANVQSSLQEQGYYEGEIDGVLNSDTQFALSEYQQGQGLEVTAAVDEPTLESLGLTNENSD